MLPLFVSKETWPVRNKVPNREFYWSADHEFYIRLRNWNRKSVWCAGKFVRKIMLLSKSESSLEKKQFHLSIFSQTSRKPIRKRKVYKTKVVIQNSAIKCHHEFHVRSHKNSSISIGYFFSLTNKSNLIVALSKIKGTILRWKKIS